MESTVNPIVSKANIAHLNNYSLSKSPSAWQTMRSTIIKDLRIAKRYLPNLLGTFIELIVGGALGVAASAVELLVLALAREVNRDARARDRRRWPRSPDGGVRGDPRGCRPGLHRHRRCTSTISSKAFSTSALFSHPFKASTTLAKHPFL